ncbi:hypothetical protein [Streptomyces europaeiscabiei]|uniref:hypothetical protein n=1 Tax=Streptomyces europaeiscabiei TaxID=146819 RepID=UPI002E11BFBD|nr:hypothetical protein OHB30_49450 [Streptomyces europaeiscabiei]
MRTTLMLAVRLIRGGGRAGALRLALTAAGTAVGVAVVVLAAVLPGVLNARAESSAARLPDLAAPGRQGAFHFVSVEDDWNGRRFTRIFLSPAAPGTAPPPGTDRFPAPGEVIASDAAAELIRRGGPAAKKAPGRLTGRIAPDGLLGPGELYAYVGLPAGRLAAGTPAVGFGTAETDHLVVSVYEGVARQLAAILLLPTLCYLAVCGRLGAAVRARRNAALRLLGASRATVTGAAAVESTVAGTAGAVAGLSGYALVEPWLSGSGLLGFTWYPARSLPALSLCAVVVVGTALLSALVGAAGVWWRRGTAHRPVAGMLASFRWWMLVPLLTGLGLMLPPLTRSARIPSGERADVPDLLIVLVLTGMALAALGTLSLSRPLARLSGRALAHPRLPLTVRIAGRRLQHGASPVMSPHALLVGFIMMAGMGAGVLHDQELGAAPDPRDFHIGVDARRVPEARGRAEVTAVAREAADRAWLLQYSALPLAPSGTDAPGVTLSPNSVSGSADSGNAPSAETAETPMVTAACEVVRKLTGSPLPDCRDGAEYRFGSPGRFSAAPPAGLGLVFDNASGGQSRYRTPEAFLPIPQAETTLLGPGGILVTGEQPRFGWAKQILTYVSVAGHESRASRFAAAVSAVEPLAVIDVKDRNPAALETYRAHRGVTTFAVAVGFLLAALALLIAVADHIAQRRGEVAHLFVLGVPNRWVRAAQLVQTITPLGCSFGLALVTGHVSGSAWLQLNGRYVGWYSGTWPPMLALAGTGLAIAAMAALPALTKSRAASRF